MTIHVNLWDVLVDVFQDGRSHCKIWDKVAEGQYPFGYAFKLTNPSMTSVQSAGDKGAGW